MYVEPPDWLTIELEPLVAAVPLPLFPTPLVPPEPTEMEMAKFGMTDK